MNRVCPYLLGVFICSLTPLTAFSEEFSVVPSFQKQAAFEKVPSGGAVATGSSGILTQPRASAGSGSLIQTNELIGELVGYKGIPTQMTMKALNNLEKAADSAAAASKSASSAKK